MIPNTGFLLKHNPTKKPLIIVGNKLKGFSGKQISLLYSAPQAQQCQWNQYIFPFCLLNHMKTWNTTSWELEHWSVQDGIEPLRK